MDIVAVFKRTLLKTVFRKQYDARLVEQSKHYHENAANVGVGLGVKRFPRVGDKNFATPAHSRSLNYLCSEEFNDRMRAYMKQRIAAIDLARKTDPLANYYSDSTYSAWNQIVTQNLPLKDI